MKKKYYPIVTFPSKSSSKVYTVSMDNDGGLSCDCPAWVFKKAGERICRHIKEVTAQGFGTVEGKFVVLVDSLSNKEPIFCKKYPRQCDTCSLRFPCYTANTPEFSIKELRKEGIVK